MALMVWMRLAIRSIIPISKSFHWTENKSMSRNLSVQHSAIGLTLYLLTIRSSGRPSPFIIRCFPQSQIVTMKYFVKFSNLYSISTMSISCCKVTIMPMVVAWLKMLWRDLKWLSKIMVRCTWFRSVGQKCMKYLMTHGWIAGLEIRNYSRSLP